MNLSFRIEELEVVLAIANLTIGFIAYFFISHSPKIKNSYKALYDDETFSVKFVTFQRYTGLVCLGVFPTITTLIFLGKTPFDYGVSASVKPETWYWIGGLALLIFPLNFLNARKEDNLAMYPQIRKRNWTKATFITEYTGWIAYLIGYELLFRGFFLWGCVSAMSPWTAIVMNASVYAIAHIPKGSKETIGSIPLGLLLSWITLSTGTIWVALIVHIMLALSNSVFSFKFHPDMKYVKS